MRGRPAGGKPGNWRAPGGTGAGRSLRPGLGRASGGSGIRPPPRHPTRPCLRLATRGSATGPSLPFHPPGRSGKMGEVAGSGWSMGGVAESATVLTPNTQGRCDAPPRPEPGGGVSSGRVPGRATGSGRRGTSAAGRRLRHLVRSRHRATMGQGGGNRPARAGSPPSPRSRGSRGGCLGSSDSRTGSGPPPASARRRADLLHASRPEPAGRVSV